MSYVYCTVYTGKALIGNYVNTGFMKYYLSAAGGHKKRLWIYNFISLKYCSYCARLSTTLLKPKALTISLEPTGRFPLLSIMNNFHALHLLFLQLKA